jgi:hypothetical protein
MSHISFKRVALWLFVIWTARETLGVLRSLPSFLSAFAGATDLALLAKSAVGFLGTAALFWLVLNHGHAALQGLRRRRARRDP